MVDTQRSVSTILGLLPNNANGQISEQDIRDAFVSWRNGHGQIYVTEDDTATVTISVQDTWTEATEPVWSVTSGLHWFDESAGNGRLTYTGTSDCVVHIACTFSFKGATNSEIWEFGLALNGAVDNAAHVHMKIGNATDARSSALHLVTTMSTGNYISLFVKNLDSTANMTLVVANIQVMTMPT